MSFLDLSPSPEPYGRGHHAPKTSKFEQNIVNLPIMTESNYTVKESKISTNIPTHPIACMQGAFAESFMESNSGFSPPIISRPQSASARRKQLLEQDTTEETHAARWKIKKGQKHHELWKLMAQISFGIYLLLNNIARDEDQVMKILQVHVDEVDGFLESTLEDFSLAQHEIENRLMSLKSPLLNISVFDIMMEDRSFRGFIVQGNEWVERVITRTASAMNDALRDVYQGANACKYFTIYLAKEHGNLLWKDKANMRRVYEAMKGNVDGWYKAFLSLQLKGKQLDVALVQLGSIVAELDRRAGEVSRKTRFSATSSSSMSNLSVKRSSILQSRIAQQIQQSLCKGYQLKNIPDTLASLNSSTACKQNLECEAIPELESFDMAELEEPHTELLLKPHTYTPLPSPGNYSTNNFSKAVPQLAVELSVPTSSPNLTPTSEVDRHHSLRTRLSSPHKEGYEGKQENLDHRERDFNKPININLSISKTKPQNFPKNVQTPPSQGPDSAYCLDFERASSRLVTPMPTPNTQQESTFIASNSARENKNFKEKMNPRLLTPISIKSPEAQYFRHVNASPNSPLQRPWTASPIQNPLHVRPDSSGSNTSNFSACSRRNGSANVINKNSKIPITVTRHVPSAMGRSMQNREEIKVPKKKRSMFNWLKDQFSLSEEERSRFEEKIREGNKVHLATTKMDRDSGFEERKWIDGKRIERGKMGRNGRSKK